MPTPKPVSPLEGRFAYGLGHFHGSYYSGYQAARARYGFNNFMGDTRRSLASEQFHRAPEVYSAVPGEATRTAGPAGRTPRSAPLGLPAGPTAGPATGAGAPKPGGPSEPSVKVTAEAFDLPRENLAEHVRTVQGRRAAQAGLPAGNGGPERLGEGIPMPMGPPTRVGDAIPMGMGRTAPFRAAGEHGPGIFGGGGGSKGVANRGFGRGMSMPQPFVSDPPQNGPGIAPLPLSQTTSSTAGAYASWRTPGGVTPLSAETNGSTFNPSQGAYERRD